jgi:hypothetical protein
MAKSTVSERQLLISWRQQFAVIREGARMRPCRVPSNNSRGLGMDKISDV